MDKRALGINIFGGGFTLGVLQAGFNVVGQWEECGAGRRTFDLNRKYFGRIRRPLLREDWHAPKFELDLVYANPPCAPWSAANTRKGRNVDDRMSDPRLVMTAGTMETAIQLRPTVFVLESVARAYTQGRSYYDRWAEKWIDAGYSVTYYVTDALLCGVPSTRERFHFMAHAGVVDIPTVDIRTFMPRTAGMALSGLEDRFGHLEHHRPRWHGREIHETMKRCAIGQQLNEVENGVCTKWSFLYRRSAWDAPAYTVIGVETQVHPTRPRLTTAREGMRLCGYPDDFVIHPAEIGKAPTQAVLPPVGKHVAQIAASCHGRASRELEIVDHRDMAKPFRPTTVIKNMNEELI